MKKTVYGLKDRFKVIAWYRSIIDVIQEMDGLSSRFDATVFYWKDKKAMNKVMCFPVDDFFIRFIIN